MKWNTVKNGSTRTRVMFAFLPKRCDDGTTRWLENVLLEERYSRSIDWDGWEENRVSPIDKAN